MYAHGTVCEYRVCMHVHAHDVCMHVVGLGRPLLSVCLLLLLLMMLLLLMVGVL